MDIQEAIEHARQVAEGCDAQNRDCAYQHDKLADWLTVLKQIAEIFNCDPNDPAQLKWLCYKLRDWQQAEQDGRLVVLPPPAKEGYPAPKCFYNEADNRLALCLGMAKSQDDDEPMEHCKSCWYLESARQGDEAAAERKETGNG